MKFLLPIARVTVFFLAFSAISLLGPVSALAIEGGTGPTGSGVNAGTGAETPSSSTGGGLTNPLNNIDSLPKFMEVILQAVVQIGTIILTLAIVYVGFLFVQAQGNEEKIKAARSSLMWTVIGGLVLLGASTIGKVIESTVGALGS